MDPQVHRNSKRTPNTIPPVRLCHYSSTGMVSTQKIETKQPPSATPHAASHLHLGPGPQAVPLNAPQRKSSKSNISRKFDGIVTKTAKSIVLINHFQDGISTSRHRPTEGVEEGSQLSQREISAATSTLFHHLFMVIVGNCVQNRRICALIALHRNSAFSQQS